MVKCPSWLLSLIITLSAYVKNQPLSYPKWKEEDRSI